MAEFDVRATDGAGRLAPLSPGGESARARANGWRPSRKEGRADAGATGRDIIKGGGRGGRATRYGRVDGRPGGGAGETLEGAVRGRRDEASGALLCDEAGGFGGDGGGTGNASKRRAVRPASEKGRMSWSEDEQLEVTDAGRSAIWSHEAAASFAPASLEILFGLRLIVGRGDAGSEASASRRTSTSCSTSMRRSFSLASSSRTTWSTGRSTMVGEAAAGCTGDDGAQAGPTSNTAME
jgi:hypothetical protein